MSNLDRSGPTARLKRTVDLMVTVTFGCALLPLGLLIAAAIRLDSPGPVFFVQKRPGRGGRPFRIYKFRTMRVDSHRQQSQLDPDQAQQFQTFGKVVNDPRVTRVGRWLRRTSLDELPQLWNVLRGDMSLVGPRPYLRQQLGELGPRRQQILLVQPGLTGVWQVNGRNDIPLRRRMIMDLWYVRNRNLKTDGMILVRTPVAVLKGKGAY